MDKQLDTAPCGYFSLSDSGIIQSVNQTLMKMLAYERDELLGQHIEAFMSVTNKLFFHTYFYPYIQLYGEVQEMYFSMKTSGREDVPVLLNGMRHERDGSVVVDCVVVMMKRRIEHERDVLKTKTQLEELYKATHEANQRLERLHQEYETKQQELIIMNEQLEMMASTDPLTGLRNRRFFQNSLQACLTAYKLSSVPFSLLIIDIDYFKSINDTYGHPVGDLVLSRLAELLRSISRDTDMVARYGGEEFVVILSECDEIGAMMAGERYRFEAESAKWGDYSITISIGAATVSEGDNEESLLHKADTALYASKTAGRNRVTHADQRV
ncbi:PAS domain S-box protein [Paenibacillus sp. CAA11]|uniref:sensor domain-containing diguanylate cyclase n=1 Tax=Paenibacillus sp. CAA11 TaxID=1532905 RepID=UPI000D3D4117|nr:sensor domain-containing diguanylate cyclase [Paenibacillus sp. CAA11]AWB43781.1 PAS domain S-box protein [Paenibacillus sp. CAA11]